MCQSTKVVSWPKEWGNNCLVLCRFKGVQNVICHVMCHGIYESHCNLGSRGYQRKAQNVALPPKTWKTAIFLEVA